jgi:serine/threonine protein kinase
MISFTCGSCQKKLSAKDELAGKKVKCPGCQIPVAVPALGAATRAGQAKPTSAVLADARTLPPAIPAEPEESTRPPKNGGEAGKDSLADAEGPTGSRADRKGVPTRSYHAARPSREQWDFLAPAERPDEIGRLGAYRVLKVLGAGGMGVVFQAEDPNLKRKVALKAMLPTLAASETARKRFLREAQTAAAIEHDNIVPIFHVGQDRGVPFIAMPLLKGEPLDKRIKRDKALPIAEVLRIGQETAKGLAAAHTAGLVHRDIKPSNLWLEGEEGRVKILDFGLARAAADGAQLTQQGAIIGTPAYMAPEQGAGQPVDSRCDLFSLGCVLYYMSTGQPPFKAGDMVATLMAVATDNPPPPSELRPELPVALSDLVMELLAKKAENRPESAKVVVVALQQIEKQTARGAARRGRSVKKRKVGRPQLSRSPKPRGSRITERSTSDGCTLKWPLPGSGVQDYLPHVFSLCAAGYWIYQSLSLFWLNPRAFGMTSLLCFAWPLFVLVPMLRFVKPSRPEKITLGRDYFRHDLGRPGGFMAAADRYRNQGVDGRPWWRQLLGLPLLVEISKDELEQIVLERVGGQLRIRYDFGADRVEIGRYLGEPEKEWLAQVIREWQKSG